MVNGWWAATGLAGVVHPVEQREVHHPQVAVGALAHRPAAELEPERPSTRQARRYSSATTRTRSPTAAPVVGHQAGPLLVGQELGRAASRAPVPPPSPAATLNQARPLAPSCLGPVGQARRAATG